MATRRHTMASFSSLRQTACNGTSWLGVIGSGILPTSSSEFTRINIRKQVGDDEIDISLACMHPVSTSIKSDKQHMLIIRRQCHVAAPHSKWAQAAVRVAKSQFSNKQCSKEILHISHAKSSTNPTCTCACLYASGIQELACRRSSPGIHRVQQIY